MDHRFAVSGQVVSYIPVRISYRIIELFSEGLYSSPTKAVEELVANSFDAGARNVHVLLSPDRSSTDAVIVVVDDGEGMDEDGLRQHWLIGVSNKRRLEAPPAGRKQIGKFGIGKLATFVLAARLTHICKRNGKYFAVTMDYGQIPEGKAGGVEVGPEEGVNLPLRELTEEEVRLSLPPIILGNGPGHLAIPLFGPDSPPSWTIAVLSELKDMARELKKGRLSWVLRTAMPLRPDFNLYLDGEPQKPSKLDWKPAKKWVLGKDLKTLPAPAPDDLETTRDPSGPTDRQWGLTHPELGRITGFVEVYEHSLTEGKSHEIDRSHGFFVYIHGRLVNTDDPHFGLPANALRHGTFSRFRMVVHMDRLDVELRSTRETVREAVLSKVARNILHGVFNHARLWLDGHLERQGSISRAAARIEQSPGSLTRNPILGLLESALKGHVSPRLLRYPENISPQQADQWLASVRSNLQSAQGWSIRIDSIDLPGERGLALYDAETNTLHKNLVHPFISTFAEESGWDEILSLIGMAEVLTEAYLYNLSIGETQVREVMGRRDELLKHFARSSMRRSAQLIARDLEDASTNQDRLEHELVAAFNSLGFDATHIGGSGKPDGKATAHLGAAGGKPRRYSLSLEAKSKSQAGGKVSAKTVGVSTVARQRNDFDCQHAVVVAPDFPTSKGDSAALIKEAREDKEKNEATGKTITLMRVYDLARLVKLAALRPMGLDRLRKLFEECVSPEETSAWIDRVATEPATYKPSFEKILEHIWLRQSKRPDEAVEFAAVMTSLEFADVVIGKEDLVEMCRAMQRMAPQHVYVREQTVELTLPPEKVLEILRNNLKQFSEPERSLSTFRVAD